MPEAGAFRAGDEMMKERKVETKDRVALVTGGSRGIGRAICLALTGRCGHLCINYSGNEAAAKQTAGLCNEKNPELDVFVKKADVSDRKEAAALIGEVTERFGRIDILVNNAGITKDGLLISMKEEDFNRVLDVNLKGAFHCCQAAAKKMVRQRYGRIINITSYSGIHGNAGQVNYAASKAGLIGLTKSIARELAGRNITANLIAPGFIDTDMTAVLSEEAKEAIFSQIPMRRTGRPEEVAEAVRFFASENAGYYTGQILCPDGGLGM
jgi:3-oxoacyl-[acyl-carrier protein] reductase